MIKETTLTIEQIESILVGRPDSPFYIRKNIVVPNVSWGFLNHEADLLVMSPARYLTEVEIKRTWSDFMADFKKDHNHSDKHICHFFYAVPASIGEKVFNYLYEGQYKAYYHFDRSTVTALTQNNQLGCGLIVYHDPDEHHKHGWCCLTVGSKRLSDYKLSEKEEHDILRLLGMRVWALKNKVAKLQFEKNSLII